MLAIRFFFTAGQYHATPWGAHVNEAQPEWPPSPWRILRSLVAVWRRAMPSVAAVEVEDVVKTLREPPQFYLPPAGVGHSRHYMPLQKGTALVFAPFVTIPPREPALAIWPAVHLGTKQAELLAELLAYLPYLGRAESWCRADWTADVNIQPNCVPVDGAAALSGQPVSVLCASEDVGLAQLMVDTARLRGQRRGDPLAPPGSRWVTYSRPALGEAPAPRPRPPEPPVAEVVRFRLWGNPLPAVTEALAVGDMARSAAMSQFGRRHDRAQSPVLSGRAGRVVLRDDHGHAHYLAVDEDLDGRLDHLTIWAPGGLGAAEVEAICSLTELRRPRSISTKEGMPPIGLVLLGTGRQADLPYRLRGPARVWRSLTPFLLPRHPKWRGPRDDRRLVDAPEEQLRRELDHRGLSALLTAVEVEEVCKLQGQRRHWVEFRRWRQWQRPPVGGAHGFRLTFAEPVAGPITLGFGSHFSLGIFVPAEAEPGWKTSLAAAGSRGMSPRKMVPHQDGGLTSR